LTGRPNAAGAFSSKNNNVMALDFDEDGAQTWSSRVYFYKPKLAAITYKTLNGKELEIKNSTENSQLRTDNLNRKPDPKSIEHVRLLPSEFSQTQE
jgi:hypothetical protein